VSNGVSAEAGLDKKSVLGSAGMPQLKLNTDWLGSDPIAGFGFPLFC